MGGRGVFDLLNEKWLRVALSVLFVAREELESDLNEMQMRKGNGCAFQKKLAIAADERITVVEWVSISVTITWLR